MGILADLSLTPVLYQVEVGSGAGHVELPNGKAYDPGDVVNLLPDEFAQISTTAFDAEVIHRATLLENYGGGVGDTFVWVVRTDLASAVDGDLVSIVAPKAVDIRTVTLNLVGEAGTNTIDGDFTIDLEVDGTSATTFDALTVDADFALDGSVSAVAMDADDVQAVAAGEVVTVVTDGLDVAQASWTLARTATGGTFTFTMDAEATDAIAATAAGMTAAAVLAALEANANVDPGDFTVTGADGGPLTVTATADGQFGGQAVTASVDDGNATGGEVTLTPVTTGAAADSLEAVLLVVITGEIA
jgi:hypothetical protein